MNNANTDALTAINAVDLCNDDDISIVAKSDFVKVVNNSKAKTYSFPYEFYFPIINNAGSIDEYKVTANDFYITILKYHIVRTIYGKTNNGELMPIKLSANTGRIT